MVKGHLMLSLCLFTFSVTQVNSSFCFISVVGLLLKCYPKCRLLLNYDISLL